VLSSSHYIRQGGSQLISFSTPGEEAAFSGIRVGQSDFQAYIHPEDPNVYVALIGLPYNHSKGTPIVVWAVDSVGNRAQSEVAYRVIPVGYRKRVLTITDKFIRKVSSEILSRTSEVVAGQSLKETFFNINNVLRGKNHDQIMRIGRASAERLLFAHPFVQLLNSKVEAGFADERDYVYGNEVIDKQTHMGFDLASRARSDVNVANDGRVVWADYLGIYGNCVIVDHGLGLMSLYGHLSSVAVEVNQTLERGQPLGKTGATGLAGGDHLHFTTLIQGVQVNPMEWWDPKWVAEQVFGRLQAAN
jgi:murein DD-endopeptidase MepM/ murein hydrolase activator NlpD